jgi:hypothetical protein
MSCRLPQWKETRKHVRMRAVMFRAKRSSRTTRRKSSRIASFLRAGARTCGMTSTVRTQTREIADEQHVFDGRTCTEMTNDAGGFAAKLSTIATHDAAAGTTRKASSRSRLRTTRGW